tara:strand:+ start:67 stop:570 length:504 start_codon:yes stop_codon:yes gene_type:complete
MAFEQFRSPTLPVPPLEYEQSYFSSLISSLTSFFTIMDSKAGLSVDSVIANTLQLPVGALALSNGANNNIGIPQTSFVRITGPSGVFNITGITKPAKAGNNNPDGTIIILYNTTSQNMTITNNSGSSTAANRILTNTGSDVATTGTGVVTCIYSVTDSRWILLSTLT